MPEPSTVLVPNEMVGFELVLQHNPLINTVTPPSVRIAPPLVADALLIAVIELVDARVGKEPCKPIVFVQLTPSYTCNSPLTPQLVHHIVKPADAEVTGIKLRCASVMRGGKNPFVVDTTSNCAEGFLSAVDTPIPTCALLLVVINNAIISVAARMFFFMFCFSNC